MIYTGALIHGARGWVPSLGFHIPQLSSPYQHTNPNPVLVSYISPTQSALQQWLLCVGNRLLLALPTERVCMVAKLVL